MLVFSIIIPTYNSELVLSKTLDSIINQTYKNFEILVIDGDSKDNTKKIILDYASTHPIKWISEKDNGIYDAMNKGIHLAKGDWLYFIGSGDTLYNNEILEKIAAHFNRTKASFLYGNVFNEDAGRIFDGEYTYEKICNDGICHQAIFYSKDVFKEFGLYNVNMKVYAHIYLDKILFVSPSITVEYVNEIIANYDGTGFSTNNFDVVYWQNAESLLLKYYGNRVSPKTIYKSLLPFIKYNFSYQSLGVSIRASVALKSLSPLGLWLKHPLSIVRLFFTHKIKIFKQQA